MSAAFNYSKLDLSATFDTIDYETLLKRLKLTCTVSLALLVSFIVEWSSSVFVKLEDGSIVDGSVVLWRVSVVGSRPDTFPSVCR